MLDSSPRTPTRTSTVSVNQVLRALRVGQALEPRGMSSRLLAWELAEREASLDRLLAEAHRRELVERSGIDRDGCVLWQLTASGIAMLERRAIDAALLRPRRRAGRELARRPA